MQAPLGVSAGTSGATVPALLLGALMAAAAFEPRDPAVRLGGPGLTLLEVAAAAVCLGLVAFSAKGLMGLARRPPLPLVLVTAFGLVHVLSAFLAPAHTADAARFALRMVAMAGLAWLVAAAPVQARRAGLVGLVVAASGVAVLAILEAEGARWLDPILGLFREMPVTVGGLRRATAGSEHPNLAAAFLAYGLVALVALSSGASRMRLLIPVALLLALGLAFTYSRGGLVSVIVALGILALVSLLARRPVAAATATLLLVVLAGAGVTLAADVPRLRLAGEGTGGWYGARYAPVTGSLALGPGERRTTEVRVANTGQKTWSDPEGFHLSYRWYDPSRGLLGEGLRTRLPRSVGAGESVTLDAVVQAPGVPGEYLLVWDMVHEHDTWFSGQGVPPGAVRVSVGGSSAAPAALASVGAPQLAWRPGRFELWGLAWAMWKQHPWTGVGPDNFRRLYGAQAGQTYWDRRVFANSAYLETLATTGAPGFLLLVALVIGTAREALLGRQRAMPALALGSLGLISVLAVHGLVDYVLAFTGHYLVLGFTVGTAAALRFGEQGS